MQDLVQLKKFLQANTRKKVPSPIPGDEEVTVHVVTREGWSFRSKTKGMCGQRFEDMTDAEVALVLARKSIIIADELTIPGNL